LKTVPIALCIALVAAFPAHAQRPINPRPPQPAETPELPKGAWVEFEVELPEYPVADRLVEFNASVNQRNHSFIDPKTLALGDDGVVRYAMVIKVKDGVDNVTYEGIRCDSKEFKVYAVGDAGSRWIKATNAKWLPVEYKEINNQRRYLFKEVFCPREGMVKSSAEALSALKSGINAKATPRVR